MKLVVFVLNKEDLLDEALAAFLEAEVPGATILRVSHRRPPDLDL